VCRKCFFQNAVKEDYLKNLKICIIGDANVGKTCFVKRYCYSSFSIHLKTTIGADFGPSVDQKDFLVQLWVYYYIIIIYFLFISIYFNDDRILPVKKGLGQ
jgi:hypothetical protein